MKKSFISVLILSSTLALVACGESPAQGPNVSFNTLEDARGTARDNALFNAKTWRAQLYPDYDIVSRGDSTQTEDCPQGDGWASIDLIPPSHSVEGIVKLKCSTVSTNVGCLENNDFKTKSYSNENDVCQPTSHVPFPLPKIAK